MIITALRYYQVINKVVKVIVLANSCLFAHSSDTEQCYGGHGAIPVQELFANVSGELCISISIRFVNV